MALMSYKCPNCGGGLVFDPPSQKFKCEYCLSAFTEAEIRELEEKELKGKEPEEKEPEGQAENEEGQENEENRESEENSGNEENASVYICPSCGAEIVADATTAASFCYYCHNPVVLSGRLSGEYLPDYVIPFAFNKKEATDRFLSWIGKKKFIRRDFFAEKQIEMLSGIYFPYLMYSCKVDGKIEAEAEKDRTWTSGKVRYTEHKKYQVERAGTLDVKNLTRNALSKSNRELIEGVLPFEVEGLKPFQMGYLSGFQAEKRDMESSSFTLEAENEVKDFTVQSLKNSITGYSTVSLKNSETQISDPQWKYALLPVWVLTYQDPKENRLYYFAMNGQSGKIWGKLPVDKGRLMKLFAGVFLPVFAALMIGGWFL